MDAEATKLQPGQDQAQATDATENRQLIYARPDDELVKILRGWYLEDLTNQGEARQRKLNDWKMYGNDQYEPEARDAAARQKRPLLTMNYLLPTINAVEGEERANRQEIKVYGRNDIAERAAAGFNMLIRWVMNECNGEYAMSAAFKHASVCGEGWLHPDVDYFDDPEGQIVIRHVDETEIVKDHSSVAPDAGDARRLTRQRWLKDDELEGMFPGALEKVKQTVAMSGESPAFGREHDGSGFRDIYTVPGQANTKYFDGQKREWLVLEHWWFEIAPGYVAVDPANNELVELTLEEGDALLAKYKRDAAMHMMATMRGLLPFGAPAPAAPQMTKRPIKQIYQAFTVGNVLLDKGPHPVPECRRFPYVPVFAYFDKVRKEWFGVIRPVKDVQRQHNIEQSAITHLMQLLPKGGWKAPRGAYHDLNKWMNSASQPGVILEYNANKGEPKPLETPVIPRHMIEMAMSRLTTIRDISGVNVELMGQRAGGDAGVVMEMRKKAALTVLAGLFDNYRLSKKVLGKLLIAYIQKYVSPGRRFAIMGPGGEAQYVQYTEDMKFGRFGAIVDETTATVSDRMQALTVLQTVLPTVIDAGLPVPPGLLDLLPLPPNVKDEWKMMIQQQMMAQAAAPAAPVPDEPQPA